MSLILAFICVADRSLIREGNLTNLDSCSLSAVVFRLGRKVTGNVLELALPYVRIRELTLDRKILYRSEVKGQ